MKVMPLFVLSILSTIFISLLVGAEYQATPPPDAAGDPPSGVLDIVQSILQKIWTGVVLVFNAVTFNIPGAPWYVRAGTVTVIAGPIIWGIAILIRGGGGD